MTDQGTLPRRGPRRPDDRAPRDATPRDATPRDGTGRIRLDRRRRIGLVSLVGVGLIGGLIAFGLASSGGNEDPWVRTGAPIMASGWAPYWQTTEALTSFTANASTFSDVSVVAYHALDATTIVNYTQLDPAAVEQFRAAAAAADVPLIATIFDDSESGRMAAVLADPVLREQHVSTIVNLVDANGFDGVDLDYENFAFEDGRATWATTRPAWIAFLGELAERLHAEDRQLIVSVPSVNDGGQTGDSGYWVYDYAAMGGIVDRIRIMAYDYSTSEPGPIAPAAWVERVVEAAAALVPPSKLDLGIAAYGRDWVVTKSGTCPTDSADDVQTVATASAAALAAKYGVVPIWNDTTMERSFDYTETVTGADAAGVVVTCVLDRTVRYLDADAIHRRAWIAERNDLHGVAIWALGDEDPASWSGIAAARSDVAVWSAADPTVDTTIATTGTAAG